MMKTIIIAAAFNEVLNVLEKKGKKYITRNLNINRYLKEIGYEIEPEDNYPSLYIHTLLILNEKKDFQEFIPLLNEQEVFESFKKADVEEGNREVFERALDYNLHTNSKYRDLKKYNKIPANIIDIVFDTFYDCKKQLLSPKEVFLRRENIREHDKTREDIASFRSEMTNMMSSLLPKAPSNKEIELSSKINSLYKDKVETIFRDIKEGKIDAGINSLLRIKNEIWEEIDDNELKNSILKKIAYCFLEKNDYQNSVKNYEEALRFKNDHGTLSILALIYNQILEETNFNRVISELEKINPEKTEITKIRFGISSKHPDVYYACFVNEEIKDEDTLLALIQFYGQSNEFRKAFEIGDRLIQLFSKIEYKEFTSSFGIQHLQFKGVHMGLGYIDETNREIFRKGLKYITECCEYYKGKEIEKYKIDVFANKSIYETWNKNFELATEFIEYAISLDDKNYSLIKIRGVIYTRKNDYEKAIKCFEKIPTPVPEDLEDLPLLKSICYLILGDNDKAFNELESTFTKIRDLNIKQRTTEQLINLCFLAGDIDKAKRIFEANYLILPSEYEKLVRAKILNIEGKVNEGLIILDELKGEFIKSKEFSPIVPDLGNEFLRIKEHNSAIELYEAFANYSEDTFFVRALFELYFNNQQFDKAIKICEAQRKPRIHEFYTQYEIAIYLDYRDYEMVVELSEQYLLQFPDNLQIRLNLVYSEFKQGNISKAKDYLKYPFRTELLNERISENLVDIYIKLNQIEDAFELAYKLLAINKNAFYSNLYLKISFLCDAFLSSLKSNISNTNYTLQISIDSVQKFITLVEKNENDCFEYFSEIPLKDKEFHRLYKRNIGDIVTTVDGEKIQIINVNHKYVYAFQKELENANSIYKSDSFIKTFDASPLKEGKLPNELRELIALWKVDQIKFETSFQLYNKGIVPLVTLSKSFGKQLIDIWFDTIISTDKMISVCAGIRDEIEYQLKVIEENNKKELLIDTTSLLLIHKLDIIHILNQYFIVYLIQDTIDYLDNYLSLNSIAKNQRTDEIESIIVWAKANINVYPPSTFIKTDQNELAKYSEIVGQLTSKNIVLAANSDLLYLCDDLALRNFFTSEFKKPVLWTQTIIQFLNLKKAISDEKYLETISKLVELNIKHTHMSGEVILYYFNKTNHQITYNSLKFLRVLRGDYSDNSAYNVAFSYLNALWKSDAELNNKRKITFEVFWHLTMYRVFMDVENSIKKITSLLLAISV